MNRGRANVWFLAVLLLASCTNPADAPGEAGRRALVIVDMQYDFLPGGAVPAEGGDEIVGLINRLQEKFDVVVATQDWHPDGHGSFASSHPGRQPGDVVQLNGLEQVLWPDHAIQGSSGARLVAELDQSKIARVFQKGVNPEVDSYSGFSDNGQRGDTGLAAYLEAQAVTQVYVVGLALDYCVKYTALDAERLGFETTLIVDASRPANPRSTAGEEAVEVLEAAGVQVVAADTLLDSEKP